MQIVNDTPAYPLTHDDLAAGRVYACQKFERFGMANVFICSDERELVNLETGYQIGCPEYYRYREVFGAVIVTE